MAMDTSYLTTQVNTIIGQLHGIFDEIGVPRNERESRETELFTALAETLHNHLRLVNTEKTRLTEEAYKLIETIRKMETSLDDAQSNNHYSMDDRELRISYPLTQCLKDLKEKYNTVSKLHRERFEQVKKLVQALESYSSHLEPSFVKISLPPTNSSTCPPDFDLSPSYVTKLDAEFSRVYEEYTKRVAIVGATAEDVVKLWAELGTPQAQTDSNIVAHYRESPEQLGLHASDVKSLQGKKDRLVEEKKGRERRLKELKNTVEALWDRLGVEEPDRRAFLAANRGCGLRTINEFEDELNRLNELKHQNLHLFVEDARCRLQELWDSLYFSEEEMLDFTPAFSDVYSDALLSAHEAEIARLETLKEQRAPMLALVDRHRSLIKDREDLAAAANDASRLLLKPAKGERRDPGKLLREEKMRKRIAKELPKLEAELRKTLESWEDEYGRPFLVHGERFLDEMEIMAEKSKPPPRSKTPNGLPPRAKTPVNPPPSNAKHARANSQAPASRGPSVMKTTTAPASTSKTPTGTMRRNPLASSVSAASQNKSPSKLPQRAPLAKLNDGSNSPERRLGGQTNGNASATSTIRKMGPPPARAPPPKMRDLFIPPSDDTPTANYKPGRPQSTISSSTSNTSLATSASSIVRPITPEDPYDDRVERMSYMSASVVNQNRDMNGMNRPPGASHTFQDFHSSQGYSRPTSSRQISNTSSNMTAGSSAASGSENWETFDENSELGVDDHHHDSSQQSYYQQQRRFHQQQQHHHPQHQQLQQQSSTVGLGVKRPYVMDNSSLYAQQMPPPPPKMRSVMGGRPGQHHPGAVIEVVGEDGMIREGSISEAGWTDESNDCY
ncbi:putative microtubule associated protein [Phaeomoniella chlamydospora]|uniref:Putative microtubule associated protein n=1 Tax=Phaeomoniella chlamydospora TaxID=158046 RepID=A0A0G2F2N6_PHACM|nr:putative microtubule associated protein [Phaeomoniella chlamydospora]